MASGSGHGTADIACRQGAHRHAGRRGEEDELPPAFSKETYGLRHWHVGPDLGERGAHDVGGPSAEQPLDIALEDVEVRDVAEAALVDDDRELHYAVLRHHPGGLGEAGIREAERKLAPHRLLDSASVPNRRGHCSKL